MFLDHSTFQLDLDEFGERLGQGRIHLTQSAMNLVTLLLCECIVVYLNGSKHEKVEHFVNTLNHTNLPVPLYPLVTRCHQILKAHLFQDGGKV